MKNINESGRSMVEMLGVLAIIGVLSLGGIAGYTMAMNKYRANEIISAVVQAGVDCRLRNNISGDISAVGLASLQCENKNIGLVSFQVTSPEAIAVMVCKGLGTYKSTTGIAGALQPDVKSNCSSDATSTMYYMPAS